jgi:hypothetical protein
MLAGAPRGAPVTISKAIAGLFISLISIPAFPQTEDLHLSAAQWREDLAFLARELPARHANAFHYTPREQWEAAVAALDRQIPDLNSDAVWTGMQRIMALVGDGHTYLRSPRDACNLPMEIARFGDDYRVTSVAAGLEQALGTRVVKVQETPILRAVEQILPLASQDENPPWIQATVEDALTTAGTLHGLGIAPDRNAVRYTLADDAGREFSVEVRAIAPETRFTPIRPFKQPPLYRLNPESRFWCQYLPESRTLYCNVRAMQNLYVPAKQVPALVAQHNPDKLVIDLRQNSGGDYTVGERWLVHPIRDLASINRKGHLFVLVGAVTFSAAMNNAAQFRAQTAAILVGQTIGEKPNSYAEVRTVPLPNSHLTLRYSTRYYKFVESGENAIRPDREIVPSWDEYKAGRDPVLEWVLHYDPKDLGGGTIGASTSGFLAACGVVPTSMRGDDRVRILRSPTAALVGASPMVRLQDRLDHGPGGLDRVLTGE